MAKRVRASRESVAYQQLIETTAPLEKQPVQPLHVIGDRHKKRRVRALRTQQLLCFALVLTIAGTILYSQMMLTRLTTEVSKKESQLADLNSEYVALKAQQDSALSLGYIENYAQNQLGMVKMDNSQIEYVEINNPDRIEVTKDQTGLSGALAAVAKSFNAILEYLG